VVLILVSQSITFDLKFSLGYMDQLEDSQSEQIIYQC